MACFSNASGSGTPSRTGYTNIEPGTSAWNRSESMKSISARAPSSLGAPRRIPAYSTWRKQPSSTAAVGETSSGVPAKIDLGRRARGVRDDDRSLARRAGGAGELLGVGLLPPVDDPDAVRAQRPPVPLPARPARPPRRTWQPWRAGTPGRARGGGVLDHEQVPVAVEHEIRQRLRRRDAALGEPAAVDVQAHLAVVDRRHPGVGCGEGRHPVELRRAVLRRTGHRRAPGRAGCRRHRTARRPAGRPP